MSGDIQQAVTRAPGEPVEAPAGPARPLGPAAPARRRVSRSLTLAIGLILVGILVATAVVSLFWLPYELSDTTGSRLESPSAAHWLGTDKLGRDLMSQVMIGARIALAVGAGSVLIGALVGIPIGLAATFSRNWLDDTLAAVLDILIAFPVLLLAMLIVAAQGASLVSVIVAIGLAISAIVARLTRVLGKSVLSLDYVTSARTSGTSWPGIIRQHLRPNIWPTRSVNLASQFGIAVLAEASLSYLGLGAPPPNASWGRLLQEAQGTVVTAPVGAIAPGVAVVMLVIGVNLLADGLRDVVDPTRRRSR